MKTIKRLFAGLFLLTLVAAGLAYYAGYAGEQVLRQQFALNQEQARRQGYQLELQSYQRGWLKSRARWRLEPIVNLERHEGREGVTLDGLLRLTHGPLIISRGNWHLGLFALNAELDSDDPQAQSLWFWPLTQRLDQLQLVGRFGRHYQLQWRLPELTLNRRDKSLRLESAELNWRGRYDQLAGQGQLSWADMALREQAGLGLEVVNATWDFSLAYRPDWQLEAESHFRAERARWGGGGQLALSFLGVENHWTQSVEQQRLRSHYQLTAREVTGAPFKLRELDVALTLQGLPLELLERWEQLARDRLASGQPAFDALAWLSLADQSLREELTLEGELRALLGEGRARANWQANYRGLEDGGPPQTPEDWAALVSAQLNLRLEEKSLTSTPLYWLFAEHFDQHWQSRDGERHLTLAWRQGQLVLNPEKPASR